MDMELAFFHVREVVKAIDALAAAPGGQGEGEMVGERAGSLPQDANGSQEIRPAAISSPPSPERCPNCGSRERVVLYDNGDGMCDNPWHDAPAVGEVQP